MPYFDFKLHSIWIRDNREFGKNAEVQLFSLVTSDNMCPDIFAGLLKTEDVNDKVKILEAAATHILSQRQIVQIDHIPKDFRMSFGMNGYSLYRAKEIPEYFDWSLALFESDQDVREFGAKLNMIVRQLSNGGHLNNILNIIGSAATPQILAAAKLTELVAKTVASLMMQNKDDQMCIYVESFNRYENYPTLSLKGFDIEDLTGNCKISYSIFGKE